VSIRRRSRRWLGLLTFVAGLVIGGGLGLRVARAVVDLVIHSPVSAPALPLPDGSPAAAGRTPGASSSASPGPSPSAAPLPTPVCSPLVPGQSPLQPLPPPPASFAADPALDWLGCGDGRLPRTAAGFTTSGTWQVALAYTCPPPSASPAALPEVAVGAERPIAGGVTQPLLTLQGAAGDSRSQTSSVLSAGTQELVVQAPADCLWHLAVYPAVNPPAASPS
jgi:hypothetical protein